MDKKKLESFQAKLEEEPENGLLWFQFGDFLDQQLDCPIETIHAFEKALVHGGISEAELRLGVAYANHGQIEKGVELIKQSLSKKPRAHGYCFLANVYLQNGMNEEAKLACLKALELDPDFEETFFLLGEVERSTSYEKAIEYYREAIKQDPQYQLAWQALGSALVAERDTVQEGIEALSKALVLDPNDYWALAYLANAYWKIDRIDEADRYYRAAISACPKDAQFHKWYADFLNAQGRSEEADKHIVLWEGRN